MYKEVEILPMPFRIGFYDSAKDKIIIVGAMFDKHAAKREAMAQSQVRLSPTCVYDECHIVIAAFTAGMPVEDFFSKAI